MIARVVIFAACLLFPFAALAQGDAAKYSPYTSADYDFTVNLPDSGVVASPGSKDWDIAEKEVAFEWYGGTNDPIVLIQGRVDDLGSAIDAGTFQIFSDTLLENWSGDAEKFNVTNSANNLKIGDHTWNLIEVEDFSEGTTSKVYYSVFSTYVGSRIYTISLYYLQPVSDTIFNYGKPVLQGFKTS